MSVTIIRHGESTMNSQNRFAGWMDCDLSKNAYDDLDEIVPMLYDHFGKGFKYDVCYTSLLQRTIKSANYLLSELDCLHIPHIKTWRFNERHYGSLTGMSRRVCAELYGREQVQIWRRSYLAAPPEMNEDIYDITKDRRYDRIADKVPLTENIKDVEARIKKVWHEDILPNCIIKKRQNVLVMIHGTSSRAFIKIIEQIKTLEPVKQLELPNGFPLLYKFDEKGKVLRPDVVNEEFAINGLFLGDAVELERRGTLTRQKSMDHEFGDDS